MSTATINFSIDNTAWLLYNISKICGHCEVNKSPLWRKGWYDDILSHNIVLCNACGIKFSKNQYCFVCKYIYNHRDVVRNPDWIYCNICDRYTHIDCLDDNKCPICSSKLMKY